MSKSIKCGLIFGRIFLRFVRLMKFQYLMEKKQSDIINISEAIQIVEEYGN